MAWPAGRLAKLASGGIQPTTVPLAALAHGSDAAAASRLGLGLANPNPNPNPNPNLTRPHHAHAPPDQVASKADRQTETGTRE